MRVLSFSNFQVKYLLYWWFHFEKEIPINCLFTQWKWTYILDFGPWNRSALNMGYMDEQPSRMPGPHKTLENPRRNTEGDGRRWRQGDVIFFSGQGQGWGRNVTLDAVFSVTVVANGDGSVPRRVIVTKQGSYRRGWAAGKTKRPAWRAAPALSFLTCDLAFSQLQSGPKTRDMHQSCSKRASFVHLGPLHTQGWRPLTMAM
jgi:hypothetical protein